MLFEVLQGEVVHDAWKDEHVKKALDLCLPARLQIGMPDQRGRRYVKASFGPLLRQEAPSHAYAFGMIDRWAQLGSIAALTANFF